MLPPLRVHVAEGDVPGVVGTVPLLVQLEQADRLLPGHGHRHPPGGLVQVLLGVPEEARAIKGDLQTVGGLPGIPPSAQIQLPLGIPPDGAEPQVHVLRLLLVLPPPGLLTQGGQLRRQMGGGAVKDYLEPLSVKGEAVDGGVLAVAEGVPVLWGDAFHIGEKLADSCAMAEYGDGLTGVLPCQGGQGPLQPIPRLGQTLAARGPPGRVATVEGRHPRRIKVPHLPPSLVLPVPHVQLPQLRVGTQFQAPGLIDSPGRGAGAVQVAGPHRVEVLPLEALLQGLDLPETVLGHQGVVPAVDAAVQVSLRLSVADQIDGRHIRYSFF